MDTRVLHLLVRFFLIIKLTFTGILNDKLRGFYRSKYTTDGEDRYAAVTQFAVRLQTQVILIKRQSRS